MEAFFNYVIKYIQLLRISDLIDVLIVAIIFYYLINLIRETRAMQLVKGILFLFVVFFASQYFKLNALNYILGGAMQIGAFAIIVLFQPELRSLLERMGRFKVGK
ncbi:MAG: TIGR00159 family protein, partial [Clostridia bacterium]|nr:TIGR00159 family protein [Clostridia bacterium]